MPNPIQVRAAALEDREAVWKWWNDPLTRKMMKRNDPVPWEEHCAWYDGVLKADKRILYVGLYEGSKFGVVRFDFKADQVYEVSINLNPDFRGKGLASPLLEASIAHMTGTRKVRKLFATLKKANVPSMKSFAGAGFTYVDSPRVDHAGLERFTPDTELYCERMILSSPAAKSDLAIHGGTPVRSKKMPARVAFGKDEIASLMAAVEYYRSKEQDLPYQGHFEQQFCNAFVEFMGGGYADGVATGTAACFIALAALRVPPKSEVIISPVTDSGPLSSIIMQGLVPVVADSAPDSYNMGVEQFLDRVTPRTSAVMAVHCGGEPLEIDRLVDEAHKRNIRVVEDCSQAPGAVWKGRKVGTFGDSAAFSTMYRKSLMAGSSGGLVYTQDPEIFRQAQAHADRGKPVWRTDINLSDPGYAAFPALNFNTDELSCAIGLASVKRLQDTVTRRVRFLSSLVRRLAAESKSCRPSAFHEGFSPFYFPIFVDTGKITCGKMEFAKALAAEGVDLNLHYGCVISSWSWAKPYLSGEFVTTNALSMRDRSFNLFLNERYGETEVNDILTAILKVERHFMK